jgi:transposase-like protein
MAKHRAHSIEFKRQVAQEFLAGETLHGLAKRHNICRNLIRVWVQKYEAGDFDEDAQAADLLQQYEARIAALENYYLPGDLEAHIEAFVADYNHLRYHESMSSGASSMVEALTPPSVVEWKCHGASMCVPLWVLRVICPPPTPLRPAGPPA